MPQEHIDLALFEKIIGQLPSGGPHRISLQGEGEPTLHPDFWHMVERVTEMGHIPYTITNGTRLDIERILRFFPRIGISIDTLDFAEAEKIGRHHLSKVLLNLDRLLEHYEPWRIIIHTVDYGQEMGTLTTYLKGRGLEKHVVQPLQTKEDYSYRYQGMISATDHTCTYSCAFVNAPIMQFYNIRGLQLPCCYIKDASKFISLEHIKTSLDNKEIPDACRGCRELFEGEGTSKLFLV